MGLGCTWKEHTFCNYVQKLARWQDRSLQQKGKSNNLKHEELIIKHNLGRRFVIINVFEKGTICAMLLLLDGCSKFEKGFWNILLRSP